MHVGGLGSVTSTLLGVSPQSNELGVAQSTAECGPEGKKREGAN